MTAMYILYWMGTLIGIAAVVRGLNMVWETQEADYWLRDTIKSMSNTPPYVSKGFERNKALRRRADMLIFIPILVFLLFAAGAIQLITDPAPGYLILTSGSVLWWILIILQEAKMADAEYV